MDIVTVENKLDRVYITIITSSTVFPVISDGNFGVEAGALLVAGAALQENIKAQKSVLETSNVYDAYIC